MVYVNKKCRVIDSAITNTEHKPKKIFFKNFVKVLREFLCSTSGSAESPVKVIVNKFLDPIIRATKVGSILGSFRKNFRSFEMKVGDCKGNLRSELRQLWTSEIAISRRLAGNPKLDYIMNHTRDCVPCRESKENTLRIPCALCLYILSGIKWDIVRGIEDDVS